MLGSEGPENGNCLSLEFAHVDEDPVIDRILRQLHSELTLLRAIDDYLKKPHFACAPYWNVQVSLGDVHGSALGKQRGEVWPSLNCTSCILWI
jgi:hypothetical protein